jgi:hypothetical protein
MIGVNVVSQHSGIEAFPVSTLRTGHIN